MKRALGLFGLAVALSGCELYFGPDDPPPCETGLTDVASLRDPYTGECTTPGGGNCAYTTAGTEDRAQEAPSYYDWAVCGHPCEGLDESSCRAADGCRAIYVNPVFDDGPPAFAACWGTAPSGPIRGGGCQGLDAQTCSQHDDCVAVHEDRGAPSGSQTGEAGTYLYCGDEGWVCDPTGQPPPQPLRNPETGGCEPVGGGGGGCYPSADPALVAWPDWAMCDGYCESLDEASCLVADGCRGIYANVYPPTVDAYSVEFVGCWGTAPSGPIRGGTCEGLDAYACSQHDDCVAQHELDWGACPPDATPCTPPIAGFLSCQAEPTDVPQGCYSSSECGPGTHCSVDDGECLSPPDCPGCAVCYGSCVADPPPPPPPPPCSDQTTEESCIASGCQPVYEGVGCGCDAVGCTCQDWVFLACHDAAP